MAELLKLNVQTRDQLGKGPNRRLRVAGLVPGIYYDSKGHNIPVKVEMIPLQKAYAALGKAQVFELVIEKEGKTETHASLLWRVRNEPVKGLPEHVDFFGVDLNKDLKIAVRFEVVGKSKGVKLGGVVELYRDSIEVVCKPMDIPESIILDITELDIAESIRIEDVPFPEGVTPVFDDNYAVVSIIEPHEDEDEEGEDEEGSGTTEVIGKASADEESEEASE